MALSCPRCGGVVSTPPEREWDFQNYHGSRFKCERGDKFNLYIGTSKTFTIPRPSPSGFCVNCQTQNPACAVYCKDCGNKP